MTCPPSPECTTEGSRCPDVEMEVDYCSGSPCKNGGTCYNVSEDYLCVCPDDFKGKNCSTGRNSIQGVNILSGHFYQTINYMKMKKIG